jgi:hypothetical protein
MTPPAAAALGFEASFFEPASKVTAVACLVWCIIPLIGQLVGIATMYASPPAHPDDDSHSGWPN